MSEVNVRRAVSHSERADKSRARLPPLRHTAIQRGLTRQSLLHLPQEQVRPVLVGSKVSHLPAEDLQEVPAHSAAQERLSGRTPTPLQATAVRDRSASSKSRKVSEHASRRLA